MPFWLVPVSNASIFFLDNKGHNETPVAAAGISSPHSCARWLRRQSGESITSTESIYQLYYFPRKQNCISHLIFQIAILNHQVRYILFCFYHVIGIGVQNMCAWFLTLQSVNNSLRLSGFQAECCWLVSLVVGLLPSGRGLSFNLFYLFICLLQLGCYPVAVVFLHVYKIWNWLLLNLSLEGYMRSM